MNFATCFFILTALPLVDCPPQAPPVDPRFNRLITPTPPLANISATVDTCLCGLDCTCRGTEAAHVQPVTETVSCENGFCSRETAARIEPPSTVRIPAYQQDVRYIGRHYQPVKRGLFGRRGSCRGGSCGR